MLDHYYAVIMAGGGGTRLWPLSRKTRPKQMLALFDERTLFQTAVQRLQGLFPPERILVVTVREQMAELSAQCPDLPHENFLLEPSGRGTASVVGLAAVALRQRDPQAIMAVLTADHFIANEPFFRHVLSVAYQVAGDGYLVTLGINPTFAATGFGYIQQGQKIGQYADLEAYRVLRFTEKPDEQHARRMIEQGDHSWNSGMFVWRVARIWEEIEQQMPGMAAALKRIEASWSSARRLETLSEVWMGLKSETIDYGIMERASQVAVIPAAGLGWSDVGSWDSLFDVLSGDANGNIIIGGDHVGIDTRQSLIYMNKEHRLIVTIGVDDLVVVDTGDVLLVCRKDQAQKVRQVISCLKDEYQSEEYL
jgi:mannose-1-phosphate guanylyltransferase